MASYYVWNAAVGSANGTSWANAYTTLTLAFSGKVAGDTYYVAHDHAESSGSTITLASLGLITNQTKVICVNRAGSVPPVSADRRNTAQIATTGNISINFSGFTHYDGIIFVAGNSTGIASLALAQASPAWLRFDNCSLRIGSTGAGRIYTALNSGVYIELNNTTLSFSAVGQRFELLNTLKWRNTPAALIGGAVPTTLFTLTTGHGSDVECIGVDLSAAGSGKTICGASSTSESIRFRLIDCKLDAAVTKSAVPTAVGHETDFVRSGSSGINYTVHSHRISGLLTEEATIVRTGGALA